MSSESSIKTSTIIIASAATIVTGVLGEWLSASRLSYIFGDLAKLSHVELYLSDNHTSICYLF